MTANLLTRMEFGRSTIAEIALLSGSPKSTIYRRYKDLRSLVVAAMEREMSEEIFPVPDWDSSAADIECFIETIARAMNDRRARMLVSMLFAMRDDPKLASPLMRRLTDLQVKGWRPMMSAWTN